MRDIVKKQVDTTAAIIIDNAHGEHTEHRVLLAQFSENESHDAFYQTWEQKAIDKVSRMLIQEILVGGIESEVGLALAETVTEWTREYCVQMTLRATTFSRAFSGDGR